MRALGPERNRDKSNCVRRKVIIAHHLIPPVSGRPLPEAIVQETASASLAPARSSVQSLADEMEEAVALGRRLIWEWSCSASFDESHSSQLRRKPCDVRIEDKSRNPAIDTCGAPRVISPQTVASKTQAGAMTETPGARSISTYVPSPRR